MDLLKILVICLISAVMAIVFKVEKQEYAFFISIATAVCVLPFLFVKIIPQMEEIKLLINKSGIEEEYFKLAMKVLGIAYITEFTADTCRDLGQSSIAANAELAGKGAIFIVSVPLLSSVLKTALELV